MYRSEAIKERLRQQPFHPLRIIVSEGLRYDVYHPDLVLVGERDIHVGLPRRADSDIYDRVVRIALVHLVAIEDLPEPAPAG